MKILERYILKQLALNLLVCMFAFCALFLVVDFFERIDNLITEKASILDSILYFLLKIPPTINQTLPIATLVATLLTLGLLSKNSEIIAMRSSGLKVLWIAKPVLAFGLLLSLLSLLIQETVVPYANRRAQEIYDIDIKKKAQKGDYSQANFWWRDRNIFYSAQIFDSRDNSLHAVSIFDLNTDFQVSRRIDAQQVSFVNSIYRWSMNSVNEYKFHEQETVEKKLYSALPLIIDREPEEFYESSADPDSMNYRQLRRFIKDQKSNGVPVSQYLADLYEKLSFPFINVVIMLVVIPFSLRPARSASLASSFLAAVTIGFSYYAIHSFSLAMGRAEIWPALVSAWVANFLLIFIGWILSLGSESPG